MPRNQRDSTVATTAAITIGLNCATAKSPTITSAAKIAPAIGALKVAARPAAAPQPTSVRSWRPGTRSACPIAEPSTAPICTIGPSCPAEPPEPSVTADAVIFTAAVRRRITPPRSATASITSGIPWPRASGAKRRITRPATRPPSAGRKTSTQNGSARATSTGSTGSPSEGAPSTATAARGPSKKSAWNAWIRMRKTTAPIAPATPHAAAATTIAPCPLRQCEMRPLRSPSAKVFRA